MRKTNRYNENISDKLGERMKFFNSNRLINILKIFSKDKKYIVEAEIIKERLSKYSYDFSENFENHMNDVF